MVLGGAPAGPELDQAQIREHDRNSQPPQDIAKLVTDAQHRPKEAQDAPNEKNDLYSSHFSFPFGGLLEPQFLIAGKESHGFLDAPLAGFGAFRHRDPHDESAAFAGGEILKVRACPPVLLQGFEKWSRHPSGDDRLLSLSPVARPLRTLKSFEPCCRHTPLLDEAFDVLLVDLRPVAVWFPGGEFPRVAMLVNSTDNAVNPTETERLIERCGVADRLQG